MTDTQVQRPDDERVAAGLPYGWSRLAAPSATFVIVAALLAWQGVAFTDSLRYLAYLVGVVVMPGMLIWRRLMERYERSNRALGHLHLRLEDWVCGAALGYALEIPAYVVARWLGHPLGYLVVPVVVLLVLGRREVSRMFEPRRDVESRDLLSVGQVFCLAGLVCFLALWWAVTMFPAHPVVSTRIGAPDEYFHLALVGELRHHFPATYPFLEYDGGLTYQWFVHAHMAASTWVTGLSPSLVYRRFDPLVLSVLAMLGTAVLAVRLSRRPWTGPLAAAVLVLVGSFDVTGTVPGQAAVEERFLQGQILMHSPTQALAYVLMVPVTMLLLELVRPNARLGYTGWGVLVGTAAALTGTKVTVLPMAACGLVLAGVVGSLRARRVVRAPLLGALVIAGLIVVSGWVLYAGSEQPLTWGPFSATRHFMVSLGIGGGGRVGVVLVTMSLLGSWLLCAAGAVGLVRDPRTRWDPRAWWLAGTVVAGFGAMFLLGHGGLSQTYFGRTAAPLLAVASAWGLSLLYPPGSPRRLYRDGLLAAGIGGLALLGIRGVTEGWRVRHVMDGQLTELPALRIWVNLPAIVLLAVLAWGVSVLVRDVTRGRRSFGLPLVVAFIVGLGLARTLAFLGGHYASDPAPSPRYTIGADGVAAASYISRHSTPDDRVATNAHCGPAQRLPDVCDNRHFWMSALSQRRFVVEGWAYTGRSPASWEDFVFWDPALLAENDALFTSPSADSLEHFVQRHGVDWLLVDRRLGPDEPGLCSLDGVVERFASRNFLVLRVRESEVVAAARAQGQLDAEAHVETCSMESQVSE